MMFLFKYYSIYRQVNSRVKEFCPPAFSFHIVLKAQSILSQGVKPMKIKKLRYDIFFILLSLAAGGLGAVAVNKGLPYYHTLEKPPLTPPSIVFPIVWTILYVLMGLAVAGVWKSHDRGRLPAIGIYVWQLVLNALWNVWFFGLRLYLFSFIWLIALLGSVFWMAAAFYHIRPWTGKLQIPYLIWVAFAGYLNLAIWLLNRQA